VLQALLAFAWKRYGIDAGDRFRLVLNPVPAFINRPCARRESVPTLGRTPSAWAPHLCSRAPVGPFAGLGREL